MPMIRTNQWVRNGRTMIEILTGDLLEAKEKYIAHQCNCLTQNSAGTAKAIFDKFPYSNTYAGRTEPDVPATIQILGNGQDQRFVINMFAQYYPGKPKYPNSTLDGVEARHTYFHQCLLRVAKIPDLDSIAFPWKIGCNLAGGDWEWYLGTINNFAQYIEDKQTARVVIYRREGDFS
jgi:O-acetyl-ADP-ribose deacetylase (regulator of RNase III)